MHPKNLIAPVVPWFMLLASCSSPPKPPEADATRRRPANTATAVSLQVCRGELANARLRAIQGGRLAETSEALQQNMAALRQAVAGIRSIADPRPLPNSLFTVHFDYASARVDIPPEAARELVGRALTAPLILLRGRTDGRDDGPAESRMARARAAAVSAYLVAAGVAPSRIRETFQPSGDHVADNLTTRGRALNRRVEIEIYRALPEPMVRSESGRTDALAPAD